MTQPEVLQLILTISIIVVVLALCFGILVYVFQSIALYSISKRRKLGTSAFAWIPVLSSFKFGQITDDAIVNKSGTKTYFRVLLPIFYLVGMILTSISSSMITAGLGDMSQLAQLIANQDYDALAKIFEQLVYSEGFIIGVVIGVLGYFLSLIAAVLDYICVYHIYKSCSGKYVVFFVLTLLFNVLCPFFLFALCKKVNPKWYKPKDGFVGAEV